MFLRCSRDEGFPVEEWVILNGEGVLAVAVIGVDSEVFIAVFDADSRNALCLVLAEDLNKQSEVSPEGVGVALFIAADMREFVDKGKNEYVVAMILSGAIP